MLNINARKGRKLEYKLKDEEKKWIAYIAMISFLISMLWFIVYLLYTLPIPHQLESIYSYAEFLLGFSIFFGVGLIFGLIKEFDESKLAVICFCGVFCLEIVGIIFFIWALIMMWGLAIYMNLILMFKIFIFSLAGGMGGFIGSLIKEKMK